MVRAADIHATVCDDDILARFIRGPGRWCLAPDVAIIRVQTLSSRLDTVLGDMHKQ